MTEKIFFQEDGAPRYREKAPFFPILEYTADNLARGAELVGDSLVGGGYAALRRCRSGLGEPAAEAFVDAPEGHFLDEFDDLDHALGELREDEIPEGLPIGQKCADSRVRDEGRARPALGDDGGGEGFDSSPAARSEYAALALFDAVEGDLAARLGGFVDADGAPHHEGSADAGLPLALDRRPCLELAEKDRVEDPLEPGRGPLGAGKEGGEDFKKVFTESRCAHRVDYVHGAAGLSSRRGTAIYYLITDGPEGFSAFHSLGYDELYHFYAGDPVELYLLEPGRPAAPSLLGIDLAAGQRPQALVPAGRVQGARLASGGRWTLLGTTMAPGFDPSDFRLSRRDELLAAYPESALLIEALTRP